MANENFLNVPQQLALKFQAEFPGFWGFLMGLNERIGTLFTTLGDTTHLTVGTGPVVRTPDGTKKYRLGVDNAGTPTATLVP